MNIKIVPLDHRNTQHTRVVSLMVLQSQFDYGILEDDPRIFAWRTNQGEWAAATSESGGVFGIVCVVRLNDTDADALLWIEVLPQYRGKGVGRALLAWAREQTQHSLVIRNVGEELGFSQRVVGSTVAA